VRTTPVISPEVMIDDSIVSTNPPAKPPEEIAPLEIETSSLVDDNLDLASLSAKEAMSDLLRADDVVAAPEMLEDLEPTVFEGGPAEPVGALDGLVLDEPSLDLEQTLSILDDPATLDDTVEPLEGVESSDAVL